MRAMNSAIRLALIAASALLVPQSAVHAQQTDTAVANIPFAFQIGPHHLRAGKYTVQLQSDHVLILANKTDAGVMLVNWAGTRHPSEKAMLVFHRYGNNYFLREMSFGGGSDSLTSTQSKQERSVQEEAAKIDLPGQQPNIELALVEASR